MDNTSIKLLDEQGNHDSCAWYDRISRSRETVWVSMPMCLCQRLNDKSWKNGVPQKHQTKHNYEGVPLAAS